MRIDFVITELFVGGAERCLTELAVGFAKRGDDVRVFSIGSLPVGKQARLCDRLRAHQIPIETAQTDSPLGFVRAYQRLRDWLAESPPDLCQTFLFHANVIGTLAAVAARVDHRVGGLRVAERRWVRCLLERRAAKEMQSLVCVSEAVQTFAAESLGVPRSRSVVIPNAVDVGRFSQAAAVDWSALGWPSDAAVTLFVGRLAKQKGIELMQKEVDTIAPAQTDHKLLLVGDGELGDDLDRWCRSVGSDRVQRLPWQPDVAPYMRACRVLVLPSRYEGMPNVVMEAMAAGRPVVCSRVEGTAELFAGAGAGQLFSIGDSAAMARLVANFLGDRALAEQAGVQNQARMRADFSVEAMIDAYQTHYQRIIASGRPT